MADKICPCIYAPRYFDKEPKCKMFDRNQDDDIFVMCKHYLIQNSKVFCEINFRGKFK